MANDCIKPRILIYDRLDSTNLEASRISKVSFRPHWILTFEQYQGIGRYGKEWYSCAGNFSGSFLFFPDGSSLNFAQRSFSTALSVRDTLIDFGIPSRIISFKWPNDVLLNGKKVAGILLQTTVANSLKKGLIVGVGINLVDLRKIYDVDKILTETASFSEYVKPPNPRRVLDRLIHNFNYWEKSFKEGGFVKIKKNWELWGPKKGRKIKIRRKDTILEGKYLEISNLGELIAEVDGKINKFASAEVYFEGN